MKNWSKKPDPSVTRGYNDYRLFAKWTQQGVFFVTRMKDNALYEVIQQRPVPKTVMSDLTRLSAFVEQGLL